MDCIGGVADGGFATSRPFLTSAAQPRHMYTFDIAYS
jgi:hypothetical protein